MEGRRGVKRILGLIYEETQSVLEVFLENVIRDAITYTDHAKRKTGLQFPVGRTNRLLRCDRSSGPKGGDSIRLVENRICRMMKSDLQGDRRPESVLQHLQRAGEARVPGPLAAAAHPDQGRGSCHLLLPQQQL
jgi:hypothetical protein